MTVIWRCAFFAKVNIFIIDCMFDATRVIVVLIEELKVQPNILIMLSIIVNCSNLPTTPCKLLLCLTITSLSLNF